MPSTNAAARPSVSLLWLSEIVLNMPPFGPGAVKLGSPRVGIPTCSICIVSAASEAQALDVTLFHVTGAPAQRDPRDTVTVHVPCQDPMTSGGDRNVAIPCSGSIVVRSLPANQSASNPRDPMSDRTMSLTDTAGGGDATAVLGAGDTALAPGDGYGGAVSWSARRSRRLPLSNAATPSIATATSRMTTVKASRRRSGPAPKPRVEPVVAAIQAGR